MAKSIVKIIVCVRGKKCPKRGSEEICARLQEEIEQRDLEDQISIKPSKCLDLCKTGPSIIVKPGRIEYGHVTLEDCAEIVQAHSQSQVPIDRLCLKKKGKKGKQ